MTLRELLGDGPDVEITGLAYDNRKVEPGTLFFCVPGFTRDGHDFAPDAVERGAAALVVCRPLGLGVPEVQVEDMRAAMAQAAARFYGDPTARAAGRRASPARAARRRPRGSCARCSRRPGCSAACSARWPRSSAASARAVERTTPEAIDLQRTFREMLDARRRRLRDGDLLARARAAPRRGHPLHGLGLHQPQPGPPRLPSRHGVATSSPSGGCSRSTRAVRIACVDDPYGRRLAAEFPGTRHVRDRRGGRRARARRARRTPRARTSRCARADGEWPVRLGMPGRFNVLNALGAWAAARVLGAAPEPLLRDARRAAAGAGPLRARRRGPAVRGRGRLLAQAGRRSRTCCSRRAPSPRAA